jgi:hypothetical protein
LHQSFLKIIHPCLLYNIAQKFQLFRKISGAFVGFSCDVILFAGFPPIVRRFGRKACGKIWVFPDSAAFFPPAGRKIRVKRGVRHLQFVQGNDKNVQADCVCRAFPERHWQLQVLGR